MNKVVNKALVNGHPHKLPRKQRLPWMESRLRRLRYAAGKSPTPQQAARIKELERAISVLPKK